MKNKLSIPLSLACLTAAAALAFTPRGLRLPPVPVLEAFGGLPDPREAADASDGPAFKPDPLPDVLRADLVKRRLQFEAQSGNYLTAKVFTKTLREPLVPVRLAGRYLRDLKGKTVYLRKSIRDRLVSADEAMFKKKRQHLQVTYGFRSNAVQQDLYQRLAGHAKVAPPGGSFHETGMALDLANWREAQSFMIEAGFVGGCRGIEEDMVHYSVGELTKASNAAAFKRCTLREIPEDVVKGFKKVGTVTVGAFRRKK